MARQIVSSYTFNPAARQITLTGISTVDPTQVIAIYDTTLALTAAGPTSHYMKPSTFDGYPLYFADMAAGATASGSVLTLPVGSIPPQAKSTDTLKIVYGEDVSPQIVHVE